MLQTQEKTRNFYEVKRYFSSQIGLSNEKFQGG